MDLFPRARRVLLTAYADTDAAIEAINVVDLDHYLLKPWHPPEEKLYPVVDALLEAWAATPGRGRSPRPRSSGTAGRRRRSRSATSWPATWCRTAGCSPTSRRAAGCSTRPGLTEADVPLVVTARRARRWSRRPRPSWPRRSG